MSGSTTNLVMPYPTDTDLVSQGDEAIQALAERIEARLPWGRVAYAQVTADQGSLTGATNLTGLTVTLTTVAGRRYRITGYANILGGATVASYVAIREGSTDLQQGQNLLNTTSAVLHAPVITVAPSAGSHTYFLQAAFSSGTHTLKAAATYPAFISVEDIGPSTLP